MLATIYNNGSSYGAVYKALHEKTGTIVALKKQEIYGNLADIEAEIKFMRQCNGPYTVNFYGSSLEGNCMWIVMEYCAFGSVRDICVLLSVPFEEGRISLICKYVLKGLHYLHSTGKIHRDIKTDNILVNSKGQPKLADFGVSGDLNNTLKKRKTMIGTPFFLAPEVITNEDGYDSKVDIWSLGVTAIEMAETQPPYADMDPMRVLFMIPTNPPPTLKQRDKWSPQFNNFLSRCLVKAPNSRASAKELLSHDFILRYDQQEEEIRAKLVEDVVVELEKIEALEKKKKSIMKPGTGGSSSSSDNSRPGSINNTKARRESDSEKIELQRIEEEKRKLEEELNNLKQKLDTEIKKEQNTTEKVKEGKKAKKDKKTKKKANTEPILQIPVMVDVTYETAKPIGAPQNQKRISVPFGTWKKGTHATENKQKMLGEARTSKPMLIIPLSSNNSNPSLLSPRDIVPTTSSSSSRESNQDPILLSPRNYSDPSPFVSYAGPSKVGPVLSRPESTRSVTVKPVTVSDLPILSSATKPRSQTTTNAVVIPPVKAVTPSSTTSNTNLSPSKITTPAPTPSARRASGSSVSIPIPVIPISSITTITPSSVTPSTSTSAEIPSLPSASFSPTSNKEGAAVSNPSNDSSLSTTESIPKPTTQNNASNSVPTKRTTIVTIGANTTSSKGVSMDLDNKVGPEISSSVPLPLEITELVEKEEATTLRALNEWLPYYLKVAVQAENVRGILTIARVVKFVSKTTKREPIAPTDRISVDDIEKFVINPKDISVPEGEVKKRIETLDITVRGAIDNIKVVLAQIRKDFETAPLVVRHEILSAYFISLTSVNHQLILFERKKSIYERWEGKLEQLIAQGISLASELLDQISWIDGQVTSSQDIQTVFFIAQVIRVMRKLLDSPLEADKDFEFPTFEIPQIPADDSDRIAALKKAISSVLLIVGDSVTTLQQEVENAKASKSIEIAVHSIRRMKIIEKLLQNILDRYNTNGKQAAETHRKSKQSSSTTQSKGDVEISDAHNIQLDIDATLTRTLQALTAQKYGIAVTESLSEGVWRAQISRNIKKMLALPDLHVDKIEEYMVKPPATKTPTSGPDRTKLEKLRELVDATFTQIEKTIIQFREEFHSYPPERQSALLLFLQQLLQVLQ